MKTFKKIMVTALAIIGGLFVLIMVLGSCLAEETEPKEEKVVETVVKEEEPKKETTPKEEPKEEKPKKETTPKKETAPKEEPPKPKTFNYTVESFTAAINETYASVDSDTVIAPLNTEGNATTYMITANTGLITKHDEKGMINEINVLYIFDGATQLDAIEFLLASGVVIGVLNPELEKEERGNVITKELNFAELLDKDQGHEMAFVGSNIYELTSSRSIGGVQLTVFPSGSDF